VTDSDYYDGRVLMSPVSSDHPSNIQNQTPTEDARFWLGAVVESSDDAIVGKDLSGVVKS
jgi:hypothetical protein